MIITVNLPKRGQKPTNGDVIMALFPNGKIWKSDDFMCLFIEGQGDAQMFDVSWWNAIYKEALSE